MTRSLDLAAFWKGYFAVLISFVSSRLLLQTDILMVSPLGQEATAAFAVPGRLMVIDAVIAFALAPVVSVAVSRERDAAKRRDVIKASLGLTLTLSLLLTGAGLLLYPWMLDHVVADAGVREMAHSAVFWMTLSIPIRMLVFVATMCLFACGQGGRVSWIYAVTLAANAALDWLLIYRLEFGFPGSYIATCVVSAIELTWLLGLVGKEVGGIPLSRFGAQWFLDISKKIGSEWARLLSWQAEGLVVLALLASRVEWTPLLSAFGVTSEFSALLMMPLIALMRASAMQVAAAHPGGSPREGWQLLKAVRHVVLVATALVGLTLVLFSDGVGVYAYHLQGERLRWWTTFLVLYGLALPVFAYGFLARSCYQACEKFGRVTAVEIAVTWLLFMPLLWVALVKSTPLMFFSAYIAKEAIIVLWLRHGMVNEGATRALQQVEVRNP